MNNFTHYFMVCLLALSLASCKDDKTDPQPIAPLIKNVVMPAEAEAIPGSTIKIQGKGFDKADILSCVSLTNDPNFTPEVVGVDNYSITIALPANAAGTYEVSVEREKLVTTLSERLKVPYLVVIDDLALPTAAFKAGESIAILGRGFEQGDTFEFISNTYPAGVKFTQTGTLSESGMNVTAPVGAYGVNKVVIRRGNKQNTLGEVKIATEVGAEIGGGIVYYVDPDGVHGLIAKKSNVGSATQQWGPGVSADLTAGTSTDIYAGKENTRKCVEKMVVFRTRFSDWNDKKSAAEWCDQATEVIDGVTYDDWFLPSQKELIELFKEKAMLATKGAEVPANNYWSSSEGEGGDAAGWSAFYVNFYEATTVVTSNSDKVGWAIGIRPVRQF